MTGQLRIISGCWRGRKLQLPQVDSVRPTPDRIRETLFNWLAPDIIGANCLDLFSGSGALGWEALSRGAESVIFVERSRQVFNHLQKNGQLLKCERAQFFCQNVLTWLAHCDADKPFDIIFADPPFYKGLAEKSVAIIQQRCLLKKGGYLYVEVERRLPLIENLPDWQPVRNARAGEAMAWLLQCKHEL
ncbi:MAG: 16S rRNA (guanine(966)-N(2))-methyltransferase RsmD [Gammaproteobacteria bacterium]|nr:16S rRNA (guanine(966)-N(2))-methyltransferase RsmD [Gammaproteobacteria bacterium]